PPAYLLSFLTNHDAEPLHESPDLLLYVRSRMAAALGLCFRGDELSEADTANLAHEIEIYKNVRATISTGSASLLTQQATIDDGPAWDVIQETASGLQQTLMYAYQTDQGVDRIRIRPVGLDPDVMY